MEENNENVNLVENILNEEEDNINIAEEVITTIAGIAVSEISGVAEMAGGIAGGITEVLSGKKNLSKGIKAETDGNNVKIEQIGNVIIEDEVEIGANSCVDRGTIGDTIIKKGTKIDNLVHIAHNDIIGKNCFIVAQTGISGSVEVGDNTTIAGQVGVAGHLKIGSNVVIAAKSGVTNDVPDGSKMSGYPLREHMEDLRVKMSMGKVPELNKIVKKLEKEIENLKS